VSRKYYKNVLNFNYFTVYFRSATIKLMVFKIYIRYLSFLYNPIQFQIRLWFYIRFLYFHVWLFRHSSDFSCENQLSSCPFQLLSFFNKKCICVLYLWVTYEKISFHNSFIQHEFELQHSVIIMYSFHANTTWSGRDQFKISITFGKNDHKTPTKK